MANHDSEKILRIGILEQQGDVQAFIEERLVRARRSVTVGQDAKNTFAVLSGDLPDSYTLFEWIGDAFHLRLTEAMAGKLGVNQLAADEGAIDFAQLKSLGLARPHPDGGLTIALSQSSRGQVHLGDLTILFQFVEPPPAPSRLQLPKAVRGGLLNSLDWPFVNMLLVSFAVQVFGVAFIVTQDYPEAPRPEAIDRFLNPVLLHVQPPVVKAPAPTVKEPDAPTDPQTIAQAPDVRPERARAPDKASERARMARTVDRRTILGVVGSKGGDATDVVRDLLGDGASIAAMNSAFDTPGMVANLDVERDARRGVKAVGATADLGRDALIGKGRRNTIAAEKKGTEARVRGALTLKHIKDDDIIGGAVSAQSISKVIRRRSRAIRACYEKALGRNHALGGKVVLRFVVQESGRVSSVRVARDTMGDSTVGACLARNIQRWRFPKPQGGAATIEYPFIFTPAG